MENLSSSVWVGPKRQRPIRARLVQLIIILPKFLNNGIFKKVVLEKLMRFRKSYIKKEMSQNGKNFKFKVDCFWVAY